MAETDKLDTRETRQLKDLLQTMRPKRRALLMALPEHCWDIKKAGVAVGYRESYADRRLPNIIKRDVVFCEAQSLLMAEVRRQTWSIEGWRKQVLEHQRMAREKGDLATVHAYDVDIARHIGAFEQDNRQRGEQIAIIMR